MQSFLSDKMQSRKKIFFSNFLMERPYYTLNEDKKILDFFMFYSKEIMEHAPVDIEYNRICQLFNLFCMNDIIIFPCRDVQRLYRTVSCIMLIHSSRQHLYHIWSVVYKPWGLYSSSASNQLWRLMYIHSRFIRHGYISVTPITHISSHSNTQQHYM